MFKISNFRVSGSVATLVFEFDTFKTRLNVSHCLFCVATPDFFRNAQPKIEVTAPLTIWFQWPKLFPRGLILVNLAAAIAFDWGTKGADRTAHVALSVRALCSSPVSIAAGLKAPRIFVFFVFMDKTGTFFGIPTVRFPSWTPMVSSTSVPDESTSHDCWRYSNFSSVGTWRVPVITTCHWSKSTDTSKSFLIIQGLSNADCIRCHSQAHVMIQKTRQHRFVERCGNNLGLLWGLGMIRESRINCN